MLSYTWFCLVMVAQVMCEGTFRILGGDEAPEAFLPYQVFVTYVRNKQRSICGGSIISDRYILTAAHCIDDEFIKDPSTGTVRAGSTHRNMGVNIPLDKAIRHPDYSSDNKEKDIAVLRASSTIVFNENIKSLKLPTKGREVTGVVTVSGWGKTEDYTKYPVKLMYVNLPVVDQDTCRESYRSHLTENMFCAGNYTMGGVAACVGDSGGPAAQDDYLVGIVSWGEGCGLALQPTVFINVAATAMRDFITENTGL